MNLPEALVRPPPARYSPGLRYGMLLVFGLLLAWNICSVATRTPHSHAQYDNLMVAVMLLLNHVAFMCHLPPRLTAPFRIASLAFTSLAALHFFV